jgi:hypothetical protein
MGFSFIASRSMDARFERLNREVYTLIRSIMPPHFLKKERGKSMSYKLEQAYYKVK